MNCHAKQAINECAGLKAHVCTYADLAQLSGDKQRNPWFREPTDLPSTEFWYGDHGTMGARPNGLLKWSGEGDGDWNNEFLTYKGTTATVSPKAIPDAEAVVDWNAKNSKGFFTDDKPVQSEEVYMR